MLKCGRFKNFTYFFSPVIVDDDEARAAAEQRVAEQIFAVIDHYKQKDPIGLPGVPIPEPLPVPDFSQSMGFQKLDMRNANAYGLSKFRIQSVHLDMQALMVGCDAFKTGSGFSSVVFSGKNGAAVGYAACEGKLHIRFAVWSNDRTFYGYHYEHRRDRKCYFGS